MDKELTLLLELMPGYNEMEIEGQNMYQGRIGQHEVILSKCGIGKVNSALRTYRIIHAFHPELVINSGVAGGADASVAIGTLLVADGAAYHDVWCGPGTVEGDADGCPRIFRPWPRGMEIVNSMLPSHHGMQTGLIATGDRFISTADEVAAIKSLYPEAKACDMESASIAQACMACDVPFMVARVVSDTPGSGNNMSQYKNFFAEAPAKTFALLNEILVQID